MNISESASSDTGPLWFVALAVIAILASAWSATTVDEGMTVPLVWVVPPFALGLVSLGVSVLALLRIRSDENTSTQQSGSPSQLVKGDHQNDPETTNDDSLDCNSTTNKSNNTQNENGPKEVDVTEFADSKR